MNNDMKSTVLSQTKLFIIHTRKAHLFPSSRTREKNYFNIVFIPSLLLEFLIIAYDFWQIHYNAKLVNQQEFKFLEKFYRKPVCFSCWLNSSLKFFQMN